MKLKTLALLTAGVMTMSAMAAPNHADPRSRLLQQHQAAMAQKPAKPVDPKKVAYIIGYTMGNNLHKQGMELDPDLIFKGLQDSFNQKDAKYSRQEMTQILMNYRRQVMAERAEKFKKQAEVNKKQGEAFLQKNKDKKGIVTLPSGLQYQVIKAGKGRSPSDGDTVTVEYTGKTIDGKVFSSTKERGKPATFRVGQVIKGWQEALKLMKPGAQWRVFIPSNLAYGASSARAQIGPNATLIFDMKLLSFKKAAKAPKTSNNKHGQHDHATQQ